jgi:hypothetical protein
LCEKLAFGTRAGAFIRGFFKGAFCIVFHFLYLPFIIVGGFAAAFFVKCHFS